MTTLLRIVALPRRPSCAKQRREPVQIDARSRVDFDVASMPPLEKFEPFDFENVQNGSLAWHESALMNFLGYRGRKSFRKAVKRAMQACLAINIDPGRDFLMQPSGDPSVPTCVRHRLPRSLV